MAIVWELDKGGLCGVVYKENWEPVSNDSKPSQNTPLVHQVMFVLFPYVNDEEYYNSGRR